MEAKKCVKQSFTVIGMEGSTEMGQGFIQELWQAANSRFGEVSALAKKDAAGNIVGVWGTMSDLGRGFKPWENGFTKGLYLAGVEAVDGAEPPSGWTRWVVPGFEYIYVEGAGIEPFRAGLKYMEENGLTLAGAAMDFTDPAAGKSYTYFPIRKL